MSLTSELRTKSSFARTFIDREFPHLQALSIEINKSLRCFDAIEHTKYPDLYTYSIIGTATDYRIRAFFTKSSYLGSGIQRGLWTLAAPSGIMTTKLVSGRWKVIDDFENQLHGRSLNIEFNKYSKRLFSKIDPARQTLRPAQEQRLCRYCVVLARIDHAGRGSDAFFRDAMKTGIFDVERLVAAVDGRWVDDIAVLTKSFREKNAGLIGSFSNVFDGNTLAGSSDIGGADLDLVIDGRVMEIKTTVKPKITTDHLRQILGYWLLDYHDKFKIRSASVYLTRQGHEQRFDIRSDLLRTRRSMRDLRKQFRDGLRKNVPTIGLPTPNAVRSMPFETA